MRPAVCRAGWSEACRPAAPLMEALLALRFIGCMLYWFCIGFFGLVYCFKDREGSGLFTSSRVGGHFRGFVPMVHTVQLKVFYSELSVCPCVHPALHCRSNHRIVNITDLMVMLCV